MQFIFSSPDDECKQKKSEIYAFDFHREEKQNGGIFMKCWYANCHKISF